VGALSPRGGGGGIVKRVFRGVCKILETETARYMKLARYAGTIPTERCQFQRYFPEI